jgi:uncharacterized protein (TIGR02466 family)
MVRKTVKRELSPGTVVEEVLPAGTEITGEQSSKVVQFDGLFPTLFGEIKVNEINLQAMGKDILALADGKENYQGGWTSFFDQTDISGVTGMNLLAQIVLGVAAAMVREQKIAADLEKPSLQMWASVIRKDGFHGIHNHAGSVVSGTFYVKVDENSSPITFMNPTRNLRMHEPKPRSREDLGPFNSEIAVMQPTPGQMYVWPSWLEHFVDKHRGSEPRIAVSFNVDYPWDVGNADQTDSQ